MPTPLKPLFLSILVWRRPFLLLFSSFFPNSPLSLFSRDANLRSDSPATPAPESLREAVPQGILPLLPYVF
jgi:hypothetical protein